MHIRKWIKREQLSKHWILDFTVEYDIFWYESKVNLFIPNILGALLFSSILRGHILVYTFIWYLFISNSSHFIELFDSNPLCVVTVLHYGLKLKTNKLYHISSLLPFSCISYNSIWYHSMQIWNLRMCNEIKNRRKNKH